MLGRMTLFRGMNFFLLPVPDLVGDRGDILKQEFWYVIIAAKIQGNDMFLFHRSQYLLIYKVEYVLMFKK